MLVLRRQLNAIKLIFFCYAKQYQELFIKKIESKRTSEPTNFEQFYLQYSQFVSHCVASAIRIANESIWPFRLFKVHSSLACGGRSSSQVLRFCAVTNVLMMDLLRLLSPTHFGFCFSAFPLKIIGWIFSRRLNKNIRYHWKMNIVCFGFFLSPHFFIHWVYHISENLFIATTAMDKMLINRREEQRETKWLRS